MTRKALETLRRALSEAAQVHKDGQKLFALRNAEGDHEMVYQIQSLLDEYGTALAWLDAFEEHAPAIKGALTGIVKLEANGEVVRDVDGDQCAVVLHWLESTTKDEGT